MDENSIDDDIPTISAGFVRTVSPVPRDELDKLSADDLIAFLLDWRPPAASARFDGASLDGLSQTAGDAIASRPAMFVAHADALAGLRPRLVWSIVSSLERTLREPASESRGYAARLALDLAETYVAIDRGVGPWVNDIKRAVASALAASANANLIDRPDMSRALEVINTVMRDLDPTPEVEAQQAEGGYDGGMLALNGVRGEAVTAAIELLLAASRAQVEDVKMKASAALRVLAAHDTSRSVRASFGMRLPWLLANDPDHQEEWLASLFGRDVSNVARATTFDTYLVYSRFFPDTASQLADVYEAAVDRLSSDDSSSAEARDPETHLGVHLGMAEVLALDGFRSGLLRDFYANSNEPVRSATSRWIAEQAGLHEATAPVRKRAREFLRQRLVDEANPPSLAELKEFGWIARTTDRAAEALAEIVLPALERTRGVTDDQQGVADLIVRLAESRPRQASKALRLLVDGDQWGALPHVAAAELRTALTTLVSCSDPTAAATVIATIHELGKRGFLEFRELLPKETGSDG